MSSMRLEQGNPPGKNHAKTETTGDFTVSMEYPSTRYFQIHFQHLYEVIETLQQQVYEANRQIAAQNEILRTVLRQTDELPGSTGRKPAKQGRNGKNAPSRAANQQNNPSLE